MHGSYQRVTALVGDLVKNCQLNSECLICPPYPYLAKVQELLAGSEIALGAQNVSQHSEGAFTGEVSVAMLKEMGCSYVIVGHSERRALYGESDAEIAEKVIAALQGDLIPILCVGESLQQREAGETLEVIERQVAAVLNVLSPQQCQQLVIAYEPVWAIGTGLTATPQQAQQVHGHIRQLLGGAADAVRVLYGGSVKAANAAELFAQPDIDGALVGGASLNADEFMQIVQAVPATKQVV